MGNLKISINLKELLEDIASEVRMRVPRESTFKDIAEHSTQFDPITLKGYCQDAVDILKKELDPLGLDTKKLRFQLRSEDIFGNFGLNNHIVLELGDLIIDPTITQYLNTNRFVYKKDEYPFQMIGKSYLQ